VSKVLGGAGVIAALALAMGFASLNSGQRVTLRLGLITLYGVPLTVVAFGSVLTGMVVMLVAGVRSDLKVRSILRARLEAEDVEERGRFIDRDQQDLFGRAEPDERRPDGRMSDRRTPNERSTDERMTEERGTERI
jgi:hypothetical protein